MSGRVQQSNARITTPRGSVFFKKLAVYDGAEVPYGAEHPVNKVMAYEHTEENDTREYAVYQLVAVHTLERGEILQGDDLDFKKHAMKKC